MKKETIKFFLVLLFFILSIKNFLIANDFYDYPLYFVVDACDITTHPVGCACKYLISGFIHVWI